MSPIIILSLLAAGQTPAPPSMSPANLARYERCLDLATDDPKAAEGEAIKWRLEGGSYLALQCAGMAHANQRNYAAAAQAFEDAARASEGARGPRTGNYWLQAGNAWAAVGNGAKARAAVDTAIAAGDLTGEALGEAYLDRARIRVAQGEAESARADMDQALRLAPRDPLAWLLSATLARRTDNLPLAAQHIEEALKRAADDAAVQLEAGNIAALSGNEEKARAAWAEAKRLGEGKPEGDAAAKALAQFGP